MLTLNAKIDRNSRPHKTHGLSRTPIYHVWETMRARCHNPMNTEYDHYGARGISVCPQWRESFEAFYRDMGKCPKGFQIDRVDNDGDYEPSNCRWVSSKQNCRNTRRNHIITANGESLCISEWTEKTGLRHTTILRRIGRGWSERDAVTIPNQGACGRPGIRITLEALTPQAPIPPAEKKVPPPDPQPF